MNCNPETEALISGVDCEMLDDGDHCLERIADGWAMGLQDSRRLGRWMDAKQTLVARSVLRCTSDHSFKVALLRPTVQRAWKIKTSRPQRQDGGYSSVCYLQADNAATSLSQVRG